MSVEDLEKKYKIDILISTKDRSTELYGLLITLWRQTFQNWNLIIVDGSKPSPIFGIHFVQSMLNRIRLEGHRVHCQGIDINGVCQSRQLCVDIMLNNDFDGNLCLRIDDDVVLEPDYMEKLLEGIEQGYDLVSGMTPLCGNPETIRESKFVKPNINRIVANEQGDLMKIGDDQWSLYDSEEILSAHHFRSSALYKKEFHTKHSIDYKLGLGVIGFREELMMSIKALMAGLKLGVHLGAKYWHLSAPSGGCRSPDYNQLIQLDELRVRNWFKNNYKEKLGVFK